MYRPFIKVFTALLLLTTTASINAQSDAAVEGEEDQVVFQDWNLQCMGNEQRGTQCSLFQRINTTEGKTMMTVAIVRESSDRPPLIVYTVPLGVVLAPGLNVEVKNRYHKTLERNLAFSHCAESGCYAYADMDSKLIEILERGRSLTGRFRTVRGQTVAATASLYGFTDGLSALIEKSP